MTLSIQISPLRSLFPFFNDHFTIVFLSCRLPLSSSPFAARDGKSKKAFFELDSRESVNYCCELLLLLLLVFDVWAREYLLKDWEFFFFLIREERGGDRLRLRGIDRTRWWRRRKKSAAGRVARFEGGEKEINRRHMFEGWGLGEISSGIVQVRWK